MSCERTCAVCAAPIVRRRGEGVRDFYARRHCSAVCANQNRRWYLPAAPLLEVVERRTRGGTPIVRMFPTARLRRAYYRAAQEGRIAEQQAERLASSLGITPHGMIWPEVYA